MLARRHVVENHDSARSPHQSRRSDVFGLSNLTPLRMPILAGLRMSGTAYEKHGIATARLVVIIP
jgi:hypothetical protein